MISQWKMMILPLKMIDLCDRANQLRATAAKVMAKIKTVLLIIIVC